jgi:hypothetical protein
VPLNKMVVGPPQCLRLLVEEQKRDNSGQIYNKLVRINDSSATLVANNTNVFRAHLRDPHRHLRLLASGEHGSCND